MTGVTIAPWETTFSYLGLLHWFCGVCNHALLYIGSSEALYPLFTTLHSVTPQTAPILQYRFVVVLFTVCKRWSRFSKCGREIVKKLYFFIHAMKAYRGSRGIAPLILNFGIRWRWEVNIIFLPLYPGIAGYEAEWASESVWTFRRVVVYWSRLVDNYRRFEVLFDPED